MMAEMTREDSVKQFHEATGTTVAGQLNPDLVSLRYDLLSEEFGELCDELDTLYNKILDGVEIGVSDISRLLKEMADLQYVLSGLAVTFGLPLDVAFTVVHESNMSKLGDDGKPILREDGKVMKGPNYRPPNMDVIAKSWFDRDPNCQAE